MSAPEKISIDDVDYVRADSVASLDYGASGVSILVLQRGWVFVGYRDFDGSSVILRGARNIRAWGTTKGLGELVEGPTAKTILDPAGHIEAHEQTVVVEIAANADKWKAHLG